MISGGQDFAACDSERGVAFCRLSSTTATYSSFVSYYYLEALVLHMLTQRCLTPVHAACLYRQKAGVLLCGNSGAGKSSLAYECARRGWCYVSDNESWLVRNQGNALVLGNPSRIRFRDSAASLFPELLTESPFLFANGKMSISLDLRRRPELQTACEANVSHLVFLHRTSGPPGVQAFEKPRALESLLSGVPAYGVKVREQHCESLRRLVTECSVLQMTYANVSAGAEMLEGAILQ
jgi:hypothetical protein